MSIDYRTAWTALKLAIPQKLNWNAKELLDLMLACEIEATEAELKEKLKADNE